MPCVQEMSRRCTTVLLLLSSLLWCHVECNRCYQCNSRETPSCEFAGHASDWQTCEDDKCFTAIIMGNYMQTHKIELMIQYKRHAKIIS